MQKYCCFVILISLSVGCRGFKYYVIRSWRTATWLGVRQLLVDQLTVGSVGVLGRGIYGVIVIRAVFVLIHPLPFDVFVSDRTSTNSGYVGDLIQQYVLEIQKKQN